ncbi:MAG: hypothetical protein CMC05_08405 [Flavobacteriaceae bacterium]|nr:hypothetical protein [Flavobacteriaceae bacterium]
MVKPCHSKLYLLDLIWLKKLKLMGLINIGLKGKYTLRCLKFIVYKVIYPLMGILILLFLFEFEKLKEILKIIDTG